jgi:phage shock protein A
LLVAGAGLAFLPKVLKEFIARRREYNDVSDKAERRKLDLQKLALDQLRSAFDDITDRLNEENAILRKRLLAFELKIEQLEARVNELEEQNSKLRSRIRELEALPSPVSGGKE